MSEKHFKDEQFLKTSFTTEQQTKKEMKKKPDVNNSVDPLAILRDLYSEQRVQLIYLFFLNESLFFF